MVQPPCMTHRSQHTVANSDVPKAQQTAPKKKRKRGATQTEHPVEMPNEMQPGKIQQRRLPEATTLCGCEKNTEKPLVSHSDGGVTHRIAYITFKAPIITPEDVREAMKVLQAAQDANADVIDIALDRIREFRNLCNHMQRKMLGYVFCRKGSLITFLATKTASKLGRAVGKAFIQSEACMATPGIDLWVLNTTCGPITIKRSDRREDSFSLLLLIDYGYAAKLEVTDSNIKYVAFMVAMPPIQSDSEQHSDCSCAEEQRCCKVGSLEIKPITPLYHNFVGNTQKYGELWRFIHKCYAICNGDNVEMRTLLPLKMEGLLEVALRRRQQALTHLCDPGKVGNCDITHEIPEADMIQVYREWQKDVYEWMDNCILTEYQNLERAGKVTKKGLQRKSFLKKKAQAFLKKAFDTYLEQISFGSKFLLHQLIQRPLVQNNECWSAEHCAALHHFATCVLPKHCETVQRRR